MSNFRFSFQGKKGESLLSEKTYDDAEDAAFAAEYVASSPEDHYLLDGENLVSASEADLSVAPGVLSES
jgi:hypothetical protein